MGCAYYTRLPKVFLRCSWGWDSRIPLLRIFTGVTPLYGINVNGAHRFNYRIGLLELLGGKWRKPLDICVVDGFDMPYVSFTEHAFSFCMIGIWKLNYGKKKSQI